MPQSKYSPVLAGLTANDPLKLYGLLNQRRDEVRGRLERGGAYDTDEIRGLSTALGNIDSDIEATGIPAQGRQVEQNRANERSAIEAGYRGADVYQSGPNSFISGGVPGQLEQRVPSPYERMQTERRQLETDKVNAPIRQEEARTAGQVAVANANHKDQIDVLDRFFKGAGELGGDQSGYKSMSIPGIGSVTFQSQSTQPVQPKMVDLARVTNARNEYDKVRNSPMSLSSTINQAKAEYDSAVDAAILSWPVPSSVDPAIKNLALDIIRNPKTAGLDLKQALAVAGEDQLTPDELTILQQMVQIGR